MSESCIKSANTKVCSACKKVKPLTEYYSATKAPNKVYRRNKCKTCTIAIHKEHYRKNSSYYRQKAIEWHRKNPERSAAIQEEFLRRNPDYMRTYAKKYYHRKKKERVKRNAD